MAQRSVFFAHLWNYRRVIILCQAVMVSAGTKPLFLHCARALIRLFLCARWSWVSCVQYVCLGGVVYVWYVCRGESQAERERALLLLKTTPFPLCAGREGERGLSAAAGACPPSYGQRLGGEEVEGGGVAMPPPPSPLPCSPCLVSGEHAQ